jgi:hypothetical protein
MEARESFMKIFLCQNDTDMAKNSFSMLMNEERFSMFVVCSFGAQNGMKKGMECKVGKCVAGWALKGRSVASSRATEGGTAAPPLGNQGGKATSP